MLAPLFGYPLAAVALALPLPTQIHIKVFPHLYDYLPQGKDVDPAHVTLKSSGACKIYYGLAHSAGSTGRLKQSVSSLNLKLTSASLKTPLWIDCDDEVTVVRKGADTNYFYSGPIYAHAVKSGPELIENTSPNDYLKGVVPAEMPSEWPKEALKAQAVAARTYAFYHIMLNHQKPTYSEFYDVDDTVLYQAYSGDNERTDKTDQAIDETGGTMVLYQGKVIQAWFSADAAGYTEDATHVWPVTAPFAVSKTELYSDPGLDNGRWKPWSTVIPLDQMSEELRAAGVLSAGDKISDLEVLDSNRYVSGRVQAVTLHLTDGRTVTVDGLRFRREFGLKSTLFTVTMSTNHNAKIDGRGWGHGAGMSQLGARLMADMGGMDWQKILTFYYDSTDLTDPTTKP